MEISGRGISLITGIELFKSSAYKDQAGIWTIGYGTTRINGMPVLEGMIINEPVGWALLKGRLDNTETTLNKCLKIKINQNQYDALCSLCYNIGEHNFLSSTLLKSINNKLLITQDLFTRWNEVTINGNKQVSDGLTKRRITEYELFVEKI